MKLRLKANSLRFRLTQSEVAKLRADGVVSETIRFGSGTHSEFTYEIRSSDSDRVISSTFTGTRIAVVVPKVYVASWTSSTEVSLHAEQQAGDDLVLKILIEKDFSCLTRREGEKDAFPNPKAATSHGSSPSS